MPKYNVSGKNQKVIHLYIQHISEIRTVFFNKKLLIFSYVSMKINICCNTHWRHLGDKSASNAYPQHMFLWRNKKKYFSPIETHLSGAMVQST